MTRCPTCGCLCWDHVPAIEPFTPHTTADTGLALAALLAAGHEISPGQWFPFALDYRQRLRFAIATPDMIASAAAALDRIEAEDEDATPRTRTAGA